MGAEAGKLFTIEEMGEILHGMPILHLQKRSKKLTCWTVPVNLKDRDAFHISIEEYLHALISLIEELVCTPLLSYKT